MTMQLHTFVQSLRPTDTTVGVALLELIRRADDRGALDRQTWLEALSMSFRGLTGRGLLGALALIAFYGPGIHAVQAAIKPGSKGAPELS